jgi:hypothetical protein
MGRTQIVRRLESLVLYKSFNTIYALGVYLKWARYKNNLFHFEFMTIFEGCSYKRVLSTAETLSDVASFNVAVGNLAVVERRHYVSEMSQNYLCFIQLHC